MPVLDDFLDSNGFRCFMSEFMATGLMVTLYTWVCAVCEGRMMVVAVMAGFISILIFNIFGMLTGGHANPGVTITAWLMGLIDDFTALYCLLGQYLGAYIIHFLAGRILSEVMADVNGQNLSAVKGMNHVAGIILELILTIILLLGFCAIWDQRGIHHHTHAAITQGFVKSIIVGIAFKFTGASFNPAQTLVYALHSGTYDQVWEFLGVHFMAPFITRIIWGNFLSPRMPYYECSNN